MKDSIVFAKLDMNAPIDKNTEEIIDTEKILDGVKCINWCFENEAYSVVAISHQGRKKEDTLKNHTKVLEKFFPNKIKFCSNILDLPEIVRDVERGDVILLENIRSNDEEKKYSDVTQTVLYKVLKEVEKVSGKKIVYAKDDLAVCHRKDLSVYGLPIQLKKEGYEIVSGPSIKREVENAKQAKEKMKEGKMICIWGGGKFEDYLHLFEPFLEKYGNAIILTSGPLSLLFLKALGRDVGVNESTFGIENELVEKVKSLIEKYGTRIITPMDYFIENSHGREIVSSANQIGGLVVDIGPDTIKHFKHTIKSNPNSIIVGNGPLGQYEKKENSHGTFEVYFEVFNQKNRNFVIGGGGDFNAMMNILGFMPHVKSSGGKAFLELLIHGTLPGLEPLELNV